MNWSPQQEHALHRVAAWLHDGSRQVFRLFGYAGTGKTTLARHLGEGENVRYAAFTGKAAHVLNSKGCLGASTLHSLIYTPKEKSGERLRELQKMLIKLMPEVTSSPAARTKCEEIQRKIQIEEKKLRSPNFVLNEDSVLHDTGLLVIDECSMVDDRMGLDILSFGCKILVLGDPAQLPPVRGGGFFTEHKPDIMLTEIHRQAAGDPIIDLATKVRQGEALSLGQYGDSAVVDTLSAEMAMAADQIIVGRNKTRRLTNARMRQLLGYTGDVPNVGERIVCLRNNHELGLLNGSIWKVREAYGNDNPIPLSISPEDEDWRLDVLVHRAPFEGKEVDWWERRDAEEFCPGYALTCHKAQGSQWNHVLVIDESDAFREHKQKWLYTAITRAATKVVVKL